MHIGNSFICSETAAHRDRRLHRLFALTVVLIVLPGWTDGVFSQEISSPAMPLGRFLAQRSGEMPESGPHLLTATVTYHDAPGQILIVQDGAFGQMVNARFDLPMEPGDRIQFRAFAGQGIWRPQIDPESIEIVTRGGRLPRPADVQGNRLAGLDFSHHNLRRVRVMATLIAVTEKDSHTSLFLQHELLEPVQVVIPQHMEEVHFNWHHDLIGSMVTVNAVVATRFDDRGRPVGTLLYAHDFSAVENLRQLDSDVFGTSLSGLRARVSGDEPARVWGVITAVRDDGFFLQQHDSGIFLHSPVKVPFDGRSVVEVMIHPLPVDGRHEWQAIMTRQTAGQHNWQLPTMPLKELLERQTDAVLVEATGTVQEYQLGESELRLRLTVEDRDVLVIAKGDSDVLMHLDPDSIRTASMTGVCVLPGSPGYLSEFPESGQRPDHAADVCIFVEGPEGIVVHSRSGFLSHSDMAGIALALLICSAVVAAWVWALRHQVRVKTEELSLATRRLRTLHEANSDGLVVTEAGGQILLANGNAARVLGAPVGFDFTGSDLTAWLQQTFVDGENLNPERRHESSNNNIRLDDSGRLAISESPERIEQLVPTRSTPQRWFQVLVVPMSDESMDQKLYLWTFRDVNDAVAMQEELAEARKLDAVAGLAGGLAHDFNNLLQGIGGNLEIAAASPASMTPEARSRVADAQASTARAATLVGQLLRFSRADPIRLQALRVQDVLESVHPMISGIIGPGIEFRSESCPDSLWIRADRVQLEQAIVNLCLNACDAMPGGGLLTVSAALEPRHDADLSGQSEFCVAISCTDTGSGIADEHLDRVFEPFFTTKEPGQGTGLGLASALAAIRRSGGTMDVKSEHGLGTEFRILLPAISAETLEDVDSGFDHGLLTTTISGEEENTPSGQRVLIVDDEEMVRTVAVAALEQAGYATETVSNGIDALGELELSCADFGCVVLDNRMPGLSGAMVLSSIRERWPELPVVFCSGYAVEAEVDSSRCIRVLQKPYRIGDLQAAVASLISVTQPVR